MSDPISAANEDSRVEKTQAAAPQAVSSPTEPSTHNVEAIQPDARDLDTGGVGPAGLSPAVPVRRTGIQIGSRREDSPSAPRTSAPQTVGQNKPIAPELVSDNPELAAGISIPARATPVPKPSRRDRLSDELEQEIDAALGNTTLDQLLAKDSAATQILEDESRRRGVVLKVHGDNVFFSLGGRNEGVVSVRQFKEPPAPGTPLDVIVSRFNAEEGLYELRVPGAAVDVADWEDVGPGAVVEARVTGSNVGGLECLVNTLRGFIPASQVSLHRVEHFNDYIGQKLQCVVTEANPQRRNLVLSHRAILERAKEEDRKQLMQTLEVGQTREGIVRNVRDFGVFVDLGGVDGLIHVSQLSWDRVDHPNKVVQEGQKVRVRIERIDPQTGKISLAYRDLLERPWDNLEQKFPPGSLATGTVTRIAKFGAFVKLAAGIEGLVHISEMAHYRVANVSNVVREGQEVQVKVLSIDTASQRMALSIRATQAAPAAAEPEEPETDSEQPARERPQRTQPLKGGTNRSTGGDQFGLKW